MHQVCQTGTPKVQSKLIQTEEMSLFISHTTVPAFDRGSTVATSLPSRPYPLAIVAQHASQICIHNIKVPKMPKLEIINLSRCSLQTERIAWIE